MFRLAAERSTSCLGSCNARSQPTRQVPSAVEELPLEPDPSPGTSPYTPVFDIELDAPQEPELPHTLSCSFKAGDQGGSFSDFVNQNPTFQTLHQACKPAAAFELQLVTTVRSLRAEQGSSYDVHILAAGLLAHGYLVQLRDGRAPKKGGSSHLQALQHKFLVCIGFQNDMSKDPVFLEEPLIVEPRFKEHFLIAQPTLAYEKILHVAPLCFVGTLSRLENAVSTLAFEMRVAFKQQGRSLPPWRTEAALMSKWCPTQICELTKQLSFVRQALCPRDTVTDPLEYVKPEAVVLDTVVSKTRSGTKRNCTWPVPSQCSGVTVDLLARGHGAGTKPTREVQSLLATAIKCAVVCEDSTMKRAARVHADDSWGRVTTVKWV